MPHLRIRLAAASDLDSLVELEFSAFKLDRISKRSFRDLLASSAATILVAELKGSMIGSAVLLANARTSVIRLYSIAVAEGARGKGVATKLLEDALRRAAHAGAVRFRLETRFDNLDAQHLFEKAGLKPFDNVDGYYEDGARAIRYERILSNDTVS
ncbi:GNAT family N-acetyltransferase [Devosia sediminis]|uniref:GNAT family N-acetyltransferase n=1 Tax=Devosia sediminis TaxID=2798801 RepID=A0A934ITA5_9HYPH|nr:GNAT family N-acetyltransferase [Devosia sediminis]MBJ3786383.1 GNAT family N-acetyltransferase [Devosia sediminis]